MKVIDEMNAKADDANKEHEAARKKHELELHTSEVGVYFIPCVHVF
jgi:hypothetical protein